MAFFKLATRVRAKMIALVKGVPALSTERGDLFVDPSGGAAIRLKVSLGDYAGFLLELPPAVRPSLLATMLQPEEEFQVAILMNVDVKDGKTFVQGREVMFL